jgi:hypothetical protein
MTDILEFWVRSYSMKPICRPNSTNKKKKKTIHCTDKRHAPIFFFYLCHPTLSFWAVVYVFFVTCRSLLSSPPRLIREGDLGAASAREDESMASLSRSLDQLLNEMVSLQVDVLSRRPSAAGRGSRLLGAGPAARAAPARPGGVFSGRAPPVPPDGALSAQGYFLDLSSTRIIS